MTLSISNIIAYYQDFMYFYYNGLGCPLKTQSSAKYVTLDTNFSHTGCLKELS